MAEVKAHSLFTEEDVYLFREGRHFRLYEKFGSHEAVVDGISGIYFAVWAPFAEKVSVIGNFNHWNHNQHTLYPRWDHSGIWEGFVPHLHLQEVYKYSILTKDGKYLEKGDPFAFSWEQNSLAASVTTSTWYEWQDEKWLKTRLKHNNLSAPISVYEMHLASWMRGTEEPEKFFSYREIAARLIPYLKEMNFTHVEFMPVMEYPFDPSWGYQVTGFFAATSRFGAPQDLMYLIDELHQNNIGVYLDWVPSHFPGDANSLHLFDGTHLYEHEDPRKGFHPEWKSYIFNYGRPEVKSFLISNALFWLDRYHADGLRVDAVTSILYLDYAREEGAWEPNIFGENINLEAKTFLQEFNTAVYKNYPDVMTIAEESSDFPLLTKPVDAGGVGFGMKWMMGWMHDTLNYFKQDFSARKNAHHKLTFSSVYMFNENYILPLSHDEVVHGKSSLIYKMPGDEWQKFANLRVLFAYMFTHPGAKLLFMGNEFGQTHEWKFKYSLDWHLLQFPIHSTLQNFVKKVNFLYKTEKALYENQFDPHGFQWIQADDSENSVYIYLRKSKNDLEEIMLILNLKPEIHSYEIDIPAKSKWKVILNSDDEMYSGSGAKAEIDYNHFKIDKKDFSKIKLNLPPLAAVLLKKMT